MYGPGKVMPAPGAYGLRVDGLPAAGGLLGPARPDWPAVRISVESGPAVGAGEPSFTDDEASFALHAGRTVWMSRTQRRAIMTVPAPPLLDDLVHPGLSPVGACFAAWSGYETLHGSAVALNGRAWALLGAKEAGKSSTAGWFHHLGHPVVADDMVVVAEGRVFSGPRCVDLRGDAAAALGGRPLGGERTGKWRLDLPPAEPDYPPGGWVVLGWGDDVELRPLPAAERFAALGRNRVWARLPPNAELLLDLATLPAWELRRPRSWSSLADAVALLLGAVDGERAAAG